MPANCVGAYVQKEEKTRNEEVEERGMPHPPRMTAIVLGLTTWLALGGAALGQIGGKTAADGPFLLEDVEDLDLQAIGVDRPWIPDFVNNGGLTAIAFDGSGLVLMEGQSPIGGLRFRVPSSFGFVDKSFGVPVPSEPGQSTLSHPGNIVDFEKFDFLISYSLSLANQQFWIILETYPDRGGNVYPRIMWRYEPTVGSTFQRMQVPIHEPTLILDGEGFELEELLSQTRFLSFYFYGETQSGGSRTLNAHLDDIRLLPASAAPDGPTDHWAIYGPAPVDDRPVQPPEEDDTSPQVHTP